MSEPEIINTIVVPCIRTDYFPRYIDTLYKYTPHNFHLFLVDQTYEGMPEYADDERVHLYLRPKYNLGFAQGMNIGLKLAQTKYVTASNDDVEFIDDRWWQGIIDTFNMGKNIKAVNPLSVTEPGWGYGCNKNSPEELVKEKEEALNAEFSRPHEMFMHLPYKKDYDKKDYDELLTKKSGVIDGIITWMTVFEKEALEYKGYFDERFVPGGGEDYDINGRFYDKTWPTGEEREEDRYRMVATSKSWAWHWLGMSKSFKGKLKPLARERWNKWTSLWENPGHHPTVSRGRKDKVVTASL